MTMNTLFETAQPSHLGFCPQRTQHIQTVLEAAVARKHLPGAVMLVARRGEVVLSSAIGLQDPQTGQAMALDSLFRIYSMTKPIVSVALMMLVERGQVLLGAPVARYLPEFAGVQLASHIGGHAAPGFVYSVGLAPPLAGFTTILLLPAALPLA